MSYLEIGEVHLEVYFEIIILIFDNMERKDNFSSGLDPN